MFKIGVFVALTFTSAAWAVNQNQTEPLKPCEVPLLNQYEAPSAPPPLAAFMIDALVQEYRLLGGKLYWSTGKFRSGYATAGDIQRHEANRAELEQIGRRLQRALTFPIAEQQREQIEMAIGDYSKYERPLF